MGRKARRHLALFAYYYPPLGGAGSLRALSFARHLPALGWRVTVISPREGVFGEDASLGDGSLPDVRVVRTGTLEPAVVLRKLRGRGKGSEGAPGGSYVEEAKLGPVGSAIRSAARRWFYFPDSARGWISSAVAAARRVHDGDPVDAVLSSSPPVSAHVAAMRFARKGGLPWVADWRDPWSGHIEEGDPGKGRAAALERRLLHAADGLVAATGGVSRILAGVLPRGRSAVPVRNGFEPGSFPPPPPGERNGSVQLLHAGTVYGRSQDTAPLLRVLARLRGEGVRPLRLRFLGKVDPYTKEAVAAAGLSDLVEFTGFATHGSSLAAMAAADVLLLLTWSVDSPVGRAICPAKMYEYLGSGRPILALAQPGSEALELLEGIPGVFRCSFHAEAALEEALRAAGAAAAPGPVRPPESVAAFTRESQAAVLASVLDRAAAERRS